jgi:hypothetical protein
MKCSKVESLKFFNIYAAETSATEWVPATASTKSRTWTKIAEKSTIEETPATAWVPATAYTRAREHGSQ